MTHMKLTPANLQSLLEVLEMEDCAEDPDSFDRLCACAVRDAIDLTAQVQSLQAERDRLRMVVAEIAGHAPGHDLGDRSNWMRDIARKALEGGE